VQFRLSEEAVGTPVHPLTAERWQRLETLFVAAIELPLAEREPFLARETAGDADLHRDLAGMLAHSEDAGTAIARVIETAALAVVPDSLWIGRRVGAYRIRRQIGRGGMGLVFEASRDDDEFRKTVAVKIAPPWHDAARFAERFRLERQILADLEHPNIASFFDGGTAEGVPYFVMELVEGVSITAYCDRHGLALRDRIVLFRRVCAAVHFAHESLIVHRDLKPSNILVTDDGTPKLLDFGIAKLLDPLADREATSTLDAAWTPDYTSPEQVRGRPITTRTDVYSLGLILYELLTGERAQIADMTTPMALDRSICEKEPAKPSVRVSAHGASGNARQLRGDLDTIVMTAIRKEPEGRYGTVAALSEDLERYLAGRPIVARPGTAWYRAGKFLNRHRLGAAAAALTAISIALGVVSTIYQARRAERRFQQVRALANAFVFDVHDQIATLPGATAARKSIVQTALTYLESLRQDAGSDPALTRELAAAYLKVGSVQGVPQEANLGDSAGAIASFSRAQDLLAPLAARGDRVAGRMLVSALTSVAMVREAQGKFPEMLDALARAKSIGDPLVAVRHDDPELLSTMAELSEATARIAINREQFREGQEAAARGVDYSRQRLALDPGRRTFQDGMASAYNTLGQALHIDLKVREAIENFRASAAVRERLVEEDPQNAEYRRRLLISYGNTGDALGFQAGRNLGDFAGAAAFYEKAIALAQWARDKDPQDRRALYDVAMANYRLASMYYALRDFDPALARITEADQIASRLLVEDAKNSRYRSLEGSTDLAFGEVLGAMGRHDAAVRRLEGARAAAAMLPEGSLKRNIMVVSGLRLAEAKTEAGMADAVAVADDVQKDVAAKRLPIPFNDALVRTDLGQLYARMAARGWPPGQSALAARGIACLEEGIERWHAIGLPPELEGRRMKEMAAAAATRASLEPHPQHHQR
jgi:tetratricopeptide (TPR) repeat protein